MQGKLTPLPILLLLSLIVTKVQSQGICRQYTELHTETNYYTIYSQESRRTCTSTWIFFRSCSTRYYRSSRQSYYATYSTSLVTECCEGYRKSGSSCYPICRPSCINGGSCTAPATCICAKGYTGSYCQHRIRISFYPKSCPLTASEVNGTVNLCLKMNYPLTQLMSIPLQITGGSAKSGTDVIGTTRYAVFYHGKTQACVHIRIIDDDDCEITESFTVTMVKGSGYTVVKPVSCTVLIDDDDRVNLFFKQSIHLFEESMKNTDICIRSSCPCPKRMSCMLSLSNGTAQPGYDYADQSLTVTFEEGEEEACTQVRLTDNLIPEEKENFYIALLENDYYGIISPKNSTVVIADADRLCEVPPNIAGIDYIRLNDSKPWYRGVEVPYKCKEGFLIMNSTTEGPQALAKCEVDFWKIDRPCFDIKECRKTPRVCEKYCRETQGSYQCFCDWGEKLDDNGYSCNKQCGHITVPDDVQATRIIISQGIQQATLSCTKPGYIFAGQRDPTTQLCIKGQWTYEEKNYEIPSCQAPEPSIGIGNVEVMTSENCDPDVPLKLSVSNFFNNERSVSATCEPDGRKRSTNGHIVLHFRAQTVIPQKCNKSIAESYLFKLRPIILNLFDIINSGNLCLDILETTTNHTKSVCVRSEPMLTFIGQTCRQGLFFQGCECVSCAPGTFYNSSSTKCQFCPISQYQSESGQTSCKACPAGKTTRRHGTHSAFGCIEMCQAGEFSTEGDGYEPCLPCPDGGWQNKTRASFCYACDYDQKTGRKGATNGSECGCIKNSIWQDCALSCSCKNGGSCLENGICVCPEGWGGYDCSNRECPSRISCFAGVSCVLGQDNETNCGSCPDGLTGDGIHCHPVPCALGSIYNIANNTCKFCPPSQYQDEMYQISCKSCPNGTVTEKQGTNSLDDCIVECEPGSFYNKTSKICQFCPLSQYQSEYGRSSCKTCSDEMITRHKGATSLIECIEVCHAGEYSTEYDGYEPCELCPDGSWQNETGKSFCYSCNNSTYTGRRGATDSNECGLCQVGKYSVGKNMGHEPCEPCPDGNWQNETGASFCFPCGDGYHTGKEGAISGRECSVCESGSFYNKTSKICELCPLSQYQSESGTSSCKTCPDEMITRRKGATSLIKCIEVCHAGEYSTEYDGYEPCELCPDGSWQNDTGKSFCYNCTNSTYTGRKGSTDSNECGLCQVGQYSIGKNMGHEPCEPCPDGNWQNKTGASFCYPCGSGYHTGKEGAINGRECMQCNPGRFYDPTKMICELCPLSQYQDKRGQRSCKPCPKGYFTTSQGTTTKAECVGCEVFCHMGVECQLNETGGVLCGNCPKGLTGNGENCYPVCNDVYITSYLLNYKSLGKRSIILVSTDDTTVVDVTVVGSYTLYNLTSGSPLRLEYPTSAKTVAICTDTDADMTVVGINSESGSTDAFWIPRLPNTYQRETYMIMTPKVSSALESRATSTISAFYDNTEVEIIVGPGADYTISGTVHASSSQSHFTLNNMEYISIAGNNDLTGAEIQSNKPISVVSGHECARIPQKVPACDHVVEQVPPVSKYGRFFILSAFKRDAPEYIIKILASANNTKLVVICWTKNTSEILLQAELNSTKHLSFNLSSSETCFLNSSSPILVMQFSAAGTFSRTEKGDPSMTIVPHLGQYFMTGHTRFISPEIRRDRYSYQHFANIYIYYPNGSSFNSPLFDKLDIHSDGIFEEIILAQHLLPTLLQGSIYIYKGAVGQGTHTIKTDGYVSAIVYGYTQWEMYSYTAADI